MTVVFGAAVATPVPRAPIVLDEDRLPREVPSIAAPQTISEFRERVAEVLRRERVRGVAIALVDRDGPLWIGGVGDAGADTVFRVASITKNLIGLAVMRLVEQGKLDLDAPL